jgi:hypothetical protein
MTAKLAAEALFRCEANPTREKFIAAMENSYDLGGYLVRFSSTTRNGSRFTDLVVIGRDGKLVR